jgi:hypothetical protein
MPNKWIEALKAWNTEKGGPWCVPRKGSPEYDIVRGIMEGKPAKQTPKPVAKVEEKPAAKVEEKRATPIKTIPPLTLEYYSPRYYTLEQRKEKVAKTRELLESVRDVAESMSKKANEQNVRGDKPYKGRADDIKRLQKLWEEYLKMGHRESTYFYSQLEPYTSEGASYNSRGASIRKALDAVIERLNKTK